MSLHVGMLSLVFVLFGVYIYAGFRVYLYRTADQNLERRATQISKSLLDELPGHDKDYLASEMGLRYAPEINQRIIRITDAQDHVIYQSQNCLNMPFETPHPEESTYSEAFVNGDYYRLLKTSHKDKNGTLYYMELGTAEYEIERASNGLMTTFYIGFPVFLLIGTAAAYYLLGQALKPVDQIVTSAETITYRNLDQRLFVPASGDEFERITQALNRMIARLSAAFQISSRFSADASHELRTPLNIIQGELEEFLSDPLLPRESVIQVSHILDQVTRLAGIVESLLLISRLESGEAQITREAIDLGELVQTTQEQMKPLSQERRIHMQCEAKNAVKIEGNRLRLRQVLVNLIDNAIRYTPEGGRISLLVSSHKNRARFVITDSGIGISPVALPFIFDRFYRAAEVKSRRIPGSGLGLSLVQSITEAHGGKVSVDSKQGSGTTFTVELPMPAV